MVSHIEISSKERTRPYCDHPYLYKRRRTREVMVGNVGIGGGNPIRIQSMTVADTLDTTAVVQEIIDLQRAGCEIARVTVPSVKHAENLGHIKSALNKSGVDIPLVADIHFTPNAALRAADFVEKVRINPGNYADRKKFVVHEYSDEAYQRELERLEDAFKPLVAQIMDRCRTAS